MSRTSDMHTHAQNKLQYWMEQKVTVNHINYYKLIINLFLWVDEGIRD